MVPTLCTNVYAGCMEQRGWCGRRVRAIWVIRRTLKCRRRWAWWVLRALRPVFSSNSPASRRMSIRDSGHEGQKSSGSPSNGGAVRQKRSVCIGGCIRSGVITVSATRSVYKATAGGIQRYRQEVVWGECGVMGLNSVFQEVPKAEKKCVKCHSGSA